MKSREGKALVILSCVFFALRWVAKGLVGFGDSEALYASYTLHPQASYLDHPGAIGMLLALFGTPPRPEPVHTATAFLATLFPLLGYAVCRFAGATVRASIVTAIALAVAPVTAVGLFGATPDVPLAWLWLACLAAFAVALRETRNAIRDVALLLAGFGSGFALACKATGALLFAAWLIVVVTDPLLRKRAFAWFGLLAGLLPSVPLAIREHTLGYPMLTHRLHSTQHGAGVSLRNLVAVPGGQLAYVTPVMVVLAALVARHLWMQRKSDDAVTRMLLIVFLVTAIPLTLFCLWSPVAEPHWLAPAYLPLAVHAARAFPLAGPRLTLTALATACSVSIFAHLWVLVPNVPGWLPASVDMRYDIANELYGVNRLADALETTLKETADEGDKPPVVGPYWTLCAQVHAALGKATPVGCEGEIPSDFDGWVPRANYRAEPVIIYVSDTRFQKEQSPLFHSHAVASEQRVQVFRGGRVIRTFTITVLSKRGRG